MEDLLLEFLLNAAKYPHPADEVEHISTHISDIFLAGSYAYKLKKPVKFDFVDFSELEKRRYYCQQEIILNRRYAGDLYEEVVPITAIDNSCTWGGTGAVLEYAVRMKRFDGRNILSAICKRGELTADIVARAVKVISAFHRKAEVTPQYWGKKVLRDLFADNFSACSETAQARGLLALLEQVRDRVNHLMSKHEELVEKRRDNFVRRLHGDLHLGNICIYKGNPMPFDGIEFGDRYCCCDTWADLAFLIMDLLYHKQEFLAALARNVYLEETSDYDGLALLELYVAYRATVRAKVSALELLTSSTSSLTVDAQPDSFRSHLELALGSGTNKTNFVAAIGGFSGSGKSTVARTVAASINAIHIRTDAVRKNLLGIEYAHKAPQSAYSLAMSETTHRRVFELAKWCFKHGFSVLLDGVFADYSHRSMLERMCDEMNVRFVGIWFEVSPDTALERLKARRGDVSDADEAVFREQIRHPVAKLSWTRLDSSGRLEDTVKAVENIILEY